MRVNKETVKAHLHMIRMKLQENLDANEKVINSIEYALLAVDQFDSTLYAEVKRERIKRRHQKHYENRI